jgi:hypothetical protein
VHEFQEALYAENAKGDVVDACVAWYAEEMWEEQRKAAFVQIQIGMVKAGPVDIFFGLQTAIATDIVVSKGLGLAHRVWKARALIRQTRRLQRLAQLAKAQDRVGDYVAYSRAVRRIKQGDSWDELLAVARATDRVPGDFNPADFADDVARIRSESAARHGLTDASEGIYNMARRQPNVPLTNSQVDDLANWLGARKVTTSPIPNPRGQNVYKYGKNYITPDVDSHTGGTWKMFNRKGQRLGTFDAFMNRIGD